MQGLPFRLGTTSYIIPEALAPNARFLAGRLRDMELVLFELEGGPSNFPSPGEVEELRMAAQGSDLTYTVHLPLDVRLDEDGGLSHRSMIQARRVIELTAGLSPWAYVLHLEGKDFQASPVGAAWSPGAALKRWQEEAILALEALAGWAGGPERLALENLEGYPPDFLEPVLAHSPAGRCVDIGHLWRDRRDPLPFLAQALERTRVIHWHGVDENGRDHQSLRHMHPAEVDRVLAWLVDHHYGGVLTLEVFGLEDLKSSLRVLEDSMTRINSQRSEDG